MLGHLNCFDSPDSLSIISGTTASSDCAQSRRREELIFPYN